MLGCFQAGSGLTPLPLRHRGSHGRWPLEPWGQPVGERAQEPCPHDPGPLQGRYPSRVRELAVLCQSLCAQESLCPLHSDRRHHTRSPGADFKQRKSGSAPRPPGAHAYMGSCSGPAVAPRRGLGPAARTGPHLTEETGVPGGSPNLPRGTQLQAARPRPKCSTCTQGQATPQPPAPRMCWVAPRLQLLTVRRGVGSPDFSWPFPVSPSPRFR